MQHYRALPSNTGPSPLRPCWRDGCATRTTIEQQGLSVRRPADRAAARAAASSAATASAATAAAAACIVSLASLAAAAAPPPALAAPDDAAAAAVVARSQRLIAEAFDARQYYVTGDLPPGLFKDDCVFIDPTTRVVGAQKYASVVASLFDAAHSRADLLSIAPGGGGADGDPLTVVLRWRLEGQLALPGSPPVKAYTGTTIYKLDESGAVVEQLEKWDITAADAFASSFLPTWAWKGAPPAPPAEVLRAQLQQQDQGGGL